MKTYLFSYPYKSAQWGFELQADSFEDAEARLKALGWAKLDGELQAKIPAGPAWLWRLFGYAG